MGARFLDLGLDVVEGAGGYARGCRRTAPCDSRRRWRRTSPGPTS